DGRLADHLRVRVDEQMPQTCRLVDRVRALAGVGERQKRGPPAGEDTRAAGADARLLRDEASHLLQPAPWAVPVRDEDEERRRGCARKVVERVRDPERRATRDLPAAAGEVLALVEREPAARDEQCQPAREDGSAAPRDDGREPSEEALRHASSVAPATA